MWNDCNVYEWGNLAFHACRTFRLDFKYRWVMEVYSFIYKRWMVASYNYSVNITLRPITLWIFLYIIINISPVGFNQPYFGILYYHNFWICAISVLVYMGLAHEDRLHFYWTNDLGLNILPTMVYYRRDI